MLFQTSDTDHEFLQDSRDFFASLAPMVVREPISTRIIKSADKNGRRRYFVVDRSVEPQEGDLIVASGKYRHKLVRYAPTNSSISREAIWGTVVWVLQEA